MKSLCIKTNFFFSSLERETYKMFEVNSVLSVLSNTNVGTHHQIYPDDVWFESLQAFQRVNFSLHKCLARAQSKKDPQIFTAAFMENSS